MLKFGIIGCGMIAELGHLPAIKQVPSLQLYALFDVDFSRAQSLQRQFNIPHAYPSEKDFYASDIDTVDHCHL